MARPRRSPKEPASRVVAVRLTPVELEILDRLVKQGGPQATPTSVIRGLLQAVEFPVNETPGEPKPNPVNETPGEPKPNPVNETFSLEIIANRVSFTGNPNPVNETPGEPKPNPVNETPGVSFTGNPNPVNETPPGVLTEADLAAMLDPGPLEPGDRVTPLDGPYTGARGTVVRLLDDRAVVEFTTARGDPMAASYPLTRLRSL